MECKSLPFQQWPNIARDWEDLAFQSPLTSFFVTPEWVETWLEVYGPSLDPELLIFRDVDGIAGACLLVNKRYRIGPVFVRARYLNTAGEDNQDSVCVEYNDIVARPGSESAVADALTDYLDGSSWDEVWFNGIPQHSAFAAEFSRLPGIEVRRTTSPSYYVDLDAIRVAGTQFVDTLRSPTRKHVRQYLRYCGEIGELSTHPAGSVDEALAMLDELSELHQARWTSKGFAGAFGSQKFVDFHRRIIRRGFPKGYIRQYRICAGETPIGLIYAFVFRCVFYFYQSGINYSLPTRLSPGIVANVCAIEQCLKEGLSQYDFLAGDAQYKRALSSSERHLDWVVWRRPGWKFETVDRLRALKRKAMALRNG